MIRGGGTSAGRNDLLLCLSEEAVVFMLRFSGTVSSSSGLGGGVTGHQLGTSFLRLMRNTFGIVRENVSVCVCKVVGRCELACQNLRRAES